MIVQGLPGGGAALQAAVAAAGGSVTRPLDLVDGLVAQVPAAAVPGLSRAPGVRVVTPDARVRLSGTQDSAQAASSPLAHVTAAVRARSARTAGISGRGVDVAVLDSGVVPVDGLRAPGKVVNGADLSFDGGAASVRHLDGYGHGTHMAGIVAGRDDAVPVPGQGRRQGGLHRLAPDARIVNVKVADTTGATDVSQVIAGLDWVVEHGRDGDLDVRVVNLSFGTDGVQDHRLDPLAYAVERAWHAGVVVVVSAGNSGRGRTSSTTRRTTRTSSPSAPATPAARWPATTTSSPPSRASATRRGARTWSRPARR